MIAASIEKVAGASTGERLIACVAEQGSASHPYVGSAELLIAPCSTRNLADAVHFLCTIHGRYPGILDHAATRSTEGPVHAWLVEAREGFSAERTFLARLTVEAGPVPRTPGAAGAEATLVAQRRALALLAQSERLGCALGAAMALVADWSAVRPVLDTAARRFGMSVPAHGLIGKDSVGALADALGTEPLVERALLFGAQQIMLQHRGLWDLLEARQLAREAR
ncbi:MAG TPA: hypothetical protein VGR19_11915 [Allosphingosinicella sp.]|nr:hypothetical protein [Allosphingosinicella sp.]